MRRYVMLMGMVGLALALLAGCGGGSGDGDNDAPARTQTVASGGTPPGNATPEDTGSEADREDARQLRRRFLDSTFTGEYTATDIDASGIGAGTLVIYKDEQKIRVDLRTTEDGQDIEIIFIKSPDVNGFCLKGGSDIAGMLGLAPGEGACFNDDVTDSAGFGDFIAGLAALEDDDFVLRNRTTRTIAGLDAACFQTTEKNGVEPELCFSGDGALLSIGGDADGANITATAIEPDVKEDAFQLPYAVQELPDIGQ